MEEMTMRQKISVLFAVREENTVRKLMAEMDDGESCVFHIENSGAKAFRAAQRLHPDILVADAILPGLDGPALVDRMRNALGAQMPKVIGGVMMPFAREAFARHGVKQMVTVPWKHGELRDALEEAIEEITNFVDWYAMKNDYTYAVSVLEKLGMNSMLSGCAFLSWAAALTAHNESRLDAIGERIYMPIALKHKTTPQNVERLIRHAVESTMDNAKAEELYAFFGNTIDPARGKPTNAQMIGMLAQKVRVGKNKE